MEMEQKHLRFFRAIYQLVEVLRKDRQAGDALLELINAEEALHKPEQQIPEWGPPHVGIRRLLAKAGYDSLEKLANATTLDLLRISGIGPVSLRLIKTYLKENNRELIE